MYTHIPELSGSQVFLLFTATAVAGILLSWPKLSNSAVRKLFLLASILLVGGCVTLAFVDFTLFRTLGAKQNLIDWASAGFLLPAACIAFRAAIRLHRRGQPSPLAMTLAAGFAWACARETHYGGDFFDGKFWFTHNIFHLDAWTHVSYFTQFRQEMRLPYEAFSLYVIHICASTLAITAFVIWARYVIRHRTKAVLELRNFLRTLHGPLYLMGAGLYIAAELLGGLLHRMPAWGPFKGWAGAERDLAHTAVEEGMECWGAIAILFCAVALWQATRSGGQQANCAPSGR